MNSAAARVAGIALVAVALALTVTVDAVERLVLRFPGYGVVLQRLPGRGIDTSDPVYVHFGRQGTVRIDTTAIRRAGELVPDDAVFYIEVLESDPGADDVRLAAKLFLLPALPAQRPDTASWILTYRSPLTGRVPARRVEILGGGLVLTQTAGD